MKRPAANPGQRPFMVTGDSMRRIAAAVQHYEQGDRKQSPIKFRDAGDDGGERLKLCKTSEEWEYNTLATLQVWHEGTPPSESSSDETIEDVVNKVAKVAADTFVIIGQADNDSWYLVEICRECELGHRAERLTESGFDDTTGTDDLANGDGAQVLLHQNGCLTWVKLTKITVLTDARIENNALIFDAAEVWTFPDAAEGFEIEIPGTDCIAEEPPSDEGSS
jgi:hypothetical protein